MTKRIYKTFKRKKSYIYIYVYINNKQWQTLVPGTWPEHAFKRGYTIVCRRFTVETVQLNNDSTLLGIAKQRGLEV